MIGEWISRVRTAIGGRAASRAPTRPAGLLARLRRDRSGNTLAIMAASLMPITAFAGSAVDMGRLYTVKVRLQQACDAGALAGRKFLPSGVAAGQTLTGNALTQATNYFTNNLTTSWINTGWYVAGTQTFTPKTIADQQGNTQVAGTASVQVPMTLMQIFGIATQTLNVSCQASFSTPDTDVMFVLDTTGSMGCAVTRAESSCGTWSGSNGGSSRNADGSTSYYINEETDGSGNNISRIDSLRQAVKAFYNTVASTKDASTNVRYGFVPYTSTVNVGKLVYALSPSYLVSKWAYQSRIPTDDYVIKTLSSKTVVAADANACAAYNSRTPASRYNADTGDANPGYPNNGTAILNQAVWSAATSGRNAQAASCTVTTNQVGPIWTYQPNVSYDVSTYLRGNSMTDPGRVDGSTTIWNGCIEERGTTAGVTDFQQSSLPGDLDPTLVPYNDATRWRPMWADVAYSRYYVSVGGYLRTFGSPG